MYRIVVLSDGKCHNVEPGARYTFSKKEAKKLIDLFLDDECEIKVEKFIRLCDITFAWCSFSDTDKVLLYYHERCGD